MKGAEDLRKCNVDLITLPIPQWRGREWMPDSWQ